MRQTLASVWRLVVVKASRGEKRRAKSGQMEAGGYQSEECAQRMGVSGSEGAKKGKSAGEREAKQTLTDKANTHSSSAPHAIMLQGLFFALLLSETASTFLPR